MRIKNRKHSKIDKLPSDLKDSVEQMLMAGDRYADIVNYLRDNEVEISIASVCRHAKTLNANLQSIQMAQENFRVLMEEMEKYPKLDTTEALVRLTSHNMLEAVQNMEQEQWASIEPDKVLKNVTGLIRAAAYKSKIELENKGTMEQGFEAVKELVFSAMAKENPELYAQVVGFLDKQKSEV